ncbi:hypothetical protein [Candidatus Nitronereus thalassa]|uniref:Uncharacterized protein n=1 Tax=Candidatus Nitronereus thalassa TaxID=3020898 RepID=A0ABU3K3B2_9BACT|nr:hypothetical protein [Candidatus Nitronereus thalassa]MDT7040854.1 hypothetical protein [Candidatus Nitronereus thalassa]
MVDRWGSSRAPFVRSSAHSGDGMGERGGGLRVTGLRQRERQEHSQSHREKKVLAMPCAPGVGLWRGLHVCSVRHQPIRSNTIKKAPLIDR